MPPTCSALVYSSYCSRAAVNTSADSSFLELSFGSTTSTPILSGSRTESIRVQDNSILITYSDSVWASKRIGELRQGQKRKNIGIDSPRQHDRFLRFYPDASKSVWFPAHIPSSPIPHYYLLTIRSLAILFVQGRRSGPPYAHTWDWREIQLHRSNHFWYLRDLSEGTPSPDLLSFSSPAHVYLNRQLPLLLPFTASLSCLSATRVGWLV